MTRHALAERHALCDTLLSVGPVAPTLCHPWRTRDLAAHLVIREHRPDLGIGMFVPPLKGRLDEAMREMATGDYQGLVERVRRGPPAWAPTRLPAVDEVVNAVELFVHHEDVLRAEEGFASRALDRELEALLWGRLHGMGRLLFRRSPAGVVLVAEGYGRYAVKGPGEHGTVVLRGRPGELMLFAFGRTSAAQVDLRGEEDDVAALRAARLGMP